MLLLNAEDTRFDNAMEKLNIIRAEFIRNPERTGTVLSKSGKTRGTGLIWEVKHDNFLNREVEIHFLKGRAFSKD